MAESGAEGSQTLPPTNPMRTERPLETGQNLITPIEQGEVNRAIQEARERLARLDQDYQKNPEKYPRPPIAGGSPALDPDALRERIFGSRTAFSLRWTKQYGINDMVEPPPASGIKEPFDPAVALSKLLATGFSGSTAGQQASALIEDSTNEDFKVAGWTGLIPAFILDFQMRTGRLETVQAALEGGSYSLKPEGIAQWLALDKETRRALTLLLHLQGVDVVNEPGFNDKEKLDSLLNENGVLPETDHKFSDVGIGQQRFEVRLADGKPGTVTLSYDISKNEIEKYLHTVADVVETDYGIVRIAYTFFRVLGFPHQNRKFNELWALHTYDPIRKEKAIREYWARKGREGRVTKEMIKEIAGRGDFAPSETGTLIDEWKDPETLSRTLRKVLEDEGVLGLSRAINDLGAAEFYREWRDEARKLDLMDKVSDIRQGTGGASTVPAVERLSKLLTQEEYHILGAKRKFDEETKKRILSTEKISSRLGASEISFWDGLKMQFRLFQSAHTLSRPRAPIQGDRRLHEGWDEGEDYNDSGGRVDA